MRKIIFIVGLFFCSPMLFSALKNQPLKKTETFSSLDFSKKSMTQEELQNLVFEWNEYLRENPDELQRLVCFFDQCSGRYIVNGNEVSLPLGADVFFGLITYHTSNLPFYLGFSTFTLEQYFVVVFWLMLTSYLCYKHFVAREQSCPGRAIMISFLGQNPAIICAYGLMYRYWIGEVAQILKLVKTTSDKDLKVKELNKNMPHCLIKTIENLNTKYGTGELSDQQRQELLAFIRNAQRFLKAIKVKVTEPRDAIEIV